MAIRVYNTLTHKKEPFETLQPGKVGIYLCGPTVYRPSHIGHAVGPIIFDAIKRYLTYRGYQVTFVVNITDVDDKLIDEAAANKTTVPELAERITKNYLDGMARLGIDSIDLMPKASEHIGDIVAIIERLIEKGAAYTSGGDVYFDVTADSDYGKLSNRSTEDQSGQRTLAGEQKRNSADFALWKASKPDEPPEVRYDSPWGPGRPGWHIECSAMSMRYLGETFDIHGGGMDLIFPHHENEIAQSETATGKPFATYWMHNGLTRFNTKKISKSDAEMAKALEGMTLSTLLDQYDGDLLRYFVLSTHYRRPIEFSADEINAKKKGLDSFSRLFERIERITGQSAYTDASNALDDWSKTDTNAHQDFAKDVDSHSGRFFEAMDDDFNTAAAIAAMFELSTRINRFLDEQNLESDKGGPATAVGLASAKVLRQLGGLLGLFRAAPTSRRAGDETVDKVMNILINTRARARKAKQFDIADFIRDELTAAGITLEDRQDETTWRTD